jgi:hypothetical protein
MSAFLCPACGLPQLAIKYGISLSPDSRSDEIEVQLVECDACDFEGAAIYEESRRGALDSESVSHLGYRLNEWQYVSLKKQIRVCTQRDNAQCECYSHTVLGRQDEDGRWQGIPGLNWEHVFEMTLVPGP